MTQELETYLEDFVQGGTIHNSEFLNDILKILAKSGEIGSFKWNHIRVLLKWKVLEIAQGDESNWIEKDNTRFHPIVARIEKYLNFLEQEPPFTLQRICELLLRPTLYKIERTLLMIEKCLKGITITTECYKEATNEVPSVSESLEAEMMTIDNE